MSEDSASFKICLIGFMASGKSRIGRQLAKKVDANFIDLDREIELFTELDIPAIFEKQGEQAFRKLESALLKNALKMPGPTVVSTGGGTPIDMDNLSLMKYKSCVVYLDVPFEILESRLEQNKGSRPLAQDLSKLKRLFEERAPVYEQADIIHHASGFSSKSMDNLLEKISDYFR